MQELCARSIYSICITQTLNANSSSSLQCSKVSSSDVAVMSIVNSIRALLRETTKDVQCIPSFFDDPDEASTQ